MTVNQKYDASYAIIEPKSNKINSPHSNLWLYLIKTYKVKFNRVSGSASLSISRIQNFYAIPFVGLVNCLIPASVQSGW
jgi:hypothetical protein